MNKIILHIIYSLNKGGAEETLVKLVVNDKLNKHIIITLNNEDNVLTKTVKKNNLRVYNLGVKKNIFFIPLHIFKLIKIVKRENIDLIHSWMYISDVFSSICGLITRKKVIWCVRNTSLRLGSSSIYSIFSKFLEIPLSYISPVKIVYCSISAQSIHEKIGFNKKLSVYIPNGIDCNFFKPLKKRKLEKLPVTIGFPARFDKQKNHKLLLDTIWQLYKRKVDHNKVKFILAGRKATVENLKKIFNRDFEKISPYIELMGELKKMDDFYNLIDFCLSCSSYGEAFPNVIAESMSTGTPCLSSNVGDAKLIIGDAGYILDNLKTNDLLKAIVSLINMNPNEYNIKSKLSRSLILKNYSLERMISRYQKLYSKI